MREDINRLLRLQELDIELRDLQARQAAIENDLGTIAREIENDERIIREEKERFQSGRVRSKDVELEIEDKRNHLAKYQEQLFKVKTNKEYTALLHEMEGLKADIGAVEDRMLVLLQETENEQEKLKEIQADLELARQRFQERERTAQEELQAIEREMAQRREARATRAEDIEYDLLEKYEIIFAHKTDRAMVAVRNDACGGCNMELTAQTLNDLAREERICQCENCGRFIYLDEDE